MTEASGKHNVHKLHPGCQSGPAVCTGLAIYVQFMEVNVDKHLVTVLEVKFNLVTCIRLKLSVGCQTVLQELYAETA